MNRVIRADIGRIIMKKRLYVFFILSLILPAFAILLGATGLEQITNSKQILMYEGIPLNCLLVYLAVFSEEFHTGTMQCVIGRGFSRSNIVIAKFLDSLILLSWYYLWYFVVFVATSKINNLLEDKPILVSASLWGQLFLYTIISIIKASVCIAITMIILFLTWNVPIGMLIMLFIAFFSDLITKSLQNNLNIPAYRFSANGLLEAAYKRFVMGGFGWQLIAAVFLGIVIPLAITCLIFSKKEVDL